MDDFKVMGSQNIDNKLKCYHCGDDCLGHPIVFNEKPFCCDGCKTVYSILNKSELCSYYDLNETPGISQKSGAYRKDKFAFLDLPEVQTKLIQFSDTQQVHVTFYLPQIHCSSCLWLLENLYKLENGVVSSIVNFGKKELFVIYNPQETTLRKVVETLANIGYEPHISLNHLDSKDLKIPNRSRLYKIGVAGFAFGNIMMMSVPEYLLGKGAELESDISLTIKVLIIALSIPLLFYSASEFFIGAWNGLKSKYLNIDAPIALALIVTYARSLYEVFSGTGSGYFDSLAGIVFFMLVGRWLQDRTYQSISFDRDFKSFFPIAVNLIKDGKSRPVTVDQLKAEDVIQIHSQELIPVDAILSKGQAVIDYSFVSGESAPVNIAKGELLYAGGKQIGGKIELIVVKEVAQSYLTNLWNKNSNKTYQKEKHHSVIDTISTYFTYIVFTIAFLAASYWYLQGESYLMWNALTTILIVACPCALLLSSNFTNGNILRILGFNQFYLKSPNLIEKISKISHIVFDKTGTLTQHRKSKVSYQGELLTQEEQTHIVEILSQSYHPATSAILDYLEMMPQGKVDHFKLTKGKGVEAWVDDCYYKIGSAEFVGVEKSDTKGSEVNISINGQLKGIFYISNVYRFGIFDLVKKLKDKYHLSLISGDNDTEAKVLSQYFKEDETLFFNQKPDDKLAYIAHLQKEPTAQVMMIGDGLNDAGALGQSDVGIAVTDSNNTFTPASDGIIHADMLSGLDKYLEYIKDGRRIVMVSFAVSVIYNVIGVYFAVQGILSPLIAAILMPSSSISIVLLTYGMSNWLAKHRGLRTTYLSGKRIER
ncbi:MAG: heavy metal translocating P-type ATPase metal-binding domain-containing protein [Chitinophagales bacterium]|nr:heavy metal translocating P-type ATPase metal-binding domain-containing protein [Chitinophagales bacterium]